MISEVVSVRTGTDQGEVARLVATSHGGSLEITSAQGLGTTASLLLADADGGTHA
jgi:hypothetical protein